MIRFEDLVEKVQAYSPDADVELLRRAYVFSAFEHKGQVRHSGEPYLIHPLAVADLLADNALFRLRAAQGVLGLADRHGADRLEKAAAKALAVGDTAYRTIKGILATEAEADPPPAATGDGGAAAFLHGPSRLFGTVVAMPTTTAAIPTMAAMDTTTTGDHGDSGQGASA